MFNRYNINSSIPGNQRTLISNSVRENSNWQLLKSEESVRAVLESYADKFKAVGGKLTEAADHYVESKDLIKTEDFNNLFESIWMDLKTLYSEIQRVDELLQFNLGRNKKFFKILKKRIRELWNKLDITRLSISDSSLLDESYFESFSSIVSQHTYENLMLDKKTGLLHLKPKRFNISNKSYQIKNISSVTYPVHNVDGGSIHTTSELNTFEYNYGEGRPRDMLPNGLWKEQILCKDISDIQIDIKSSVDDPLYKNFIGVVTFVDIEFTYPVDINTLDVDVFGEFPMSLSHVLYKDEDGNWTPIKKLDEIPTLLETLWSDNFSGVENFDVLWVKNIEIFRSSQLRLVFNQRYYTLLDSPDMEISSLEEKINEDLSERRYEVVKLDGGADDRPAVPKNPDIESLYTRITDVIEHTRSLEDTLRMVMNILEPPPKITSVDFQKTLKYEIGAWSIEPSIQKFSGAGKFNSGSYSIRDRSLILASIKTNQESPKHTTCNWYISHPEYITNVPIIENKNLVRKEQAFLVQKDYLVNKGWTGWCIHLDFPIDRDSVSNRTFLYINGTRTALSELDYYVLNSTTIYIHNIQDQYKNKYVIEYIPESYDTANVYSLERVKRDSYNMEYEVIAARKSVLNYFLNKIGKNDIYSVKTTTCAILEYNSWFSIENNPTFNICMSNDVHDLYSTTLSSSALSIRQVANFRSQVGYSTAKNALSRNLDGVAVFYPMPSFRTERSI